MTLGQTLKEARQRKGMSLRRVEKVTQISNGYVSLLEGDQVKQPSPHHLMRLSQAYELDYSELMRLAGYAVPMASAVHSATGGQSVRFVGSAAHGGATRASAPVPSVSDLTPEERLKVEEYVAFLRSRRLRSTTSGSSRSNDSSGTT